MFFSLTESLEAVRIYRPSWLPHLRKTRQVVDMVESPFQLVRNQLPAARNEGIMKFELRVELSETVDLNGRKRRSLSCGFTL